MMNWISYSVVESYLKKKSINISFDEYGLRGVKGNKKTHLDIYSMKYEEQWKVDWNSNPECKIEDVKDFLAVFYKDYKKEFDKLIRIDEEWTKVL